MLYIPKFGWIIYIYIMYRKFRHIRIILGCTKYYISLLGKYGAQYITHSDRSYGNFMTFLPVKNHGSRLSRRWGLEIRKNCVFFFHSPLFFLGGSQLILRGEKNYYLTVTPQKFFRQVRIFGQMSWVSSRWKKSHTPKRNLHLHHTYHTFTCHIKTPWN